MKKTFTYLLALLALVSCQGEWMQDAATGGTGAEPDLGSIGVPLSRTATFADLSDYDRSGNAPTRAGDDPVQPLESLLDMECRSVSAAGGKTFVQIPFLDNKDESVVAKISADPDEQVDEKNTISVKKFYISLKTDETEGQYIVTMLTTKEYADLYPGYTFLSKPDFSGFIIYSMLDGSVITSKAYLCGQIIEADLLAPDDDSEDMLKLTFFQRTSRTRLYGGTLEAAICCAGLPSKPTGGGGGGTGNDEDDNLWWSRNDGHGNNTQDHDIDGQPFLPNLPNIPMPPQGPLDEYFTVFITSNVPSVTMHGGGSYTKGSTVRVSYSFKHSPEAHAFSHWTGEFSGVSSAAFSFMVKGPVSAVAYWDTKVPCADKNGLMNPVNDMKVAPTDIGSYKGGTYGWTRTYKNGTLKFHSGIDLAAPLGTTVFAAIEGTVTKIVNDIPGYDNKRAYGNEIRITSTVNGKQVTIQYAHLSGSEPVAYNHRLGRPFQVGDPVKAGDIIGYSGRTGNAYYVKNYHVHYGANIADNWVNPIDYINGTFDVDKIQQTEGKIDVTDCDNKSNGRMAVLPPSAGTFIGATDPADLLNKNNSDYTKSQIIKKIFK